MIFKRELKRNFKPFLIITFICSLMAVYVISIGPSMGTDIQKILDLKLPKQFQLAFGMKGLDYTSPNGFFALVFSYLYLFLGIYISGAFSSVVSKEFNDKTAEFLFSMPTTRTNIIFSKLIVVFLYSLLSIILIFLISCISMTLFINKSFEILPIVLMTLAWLIGGITFGAVGFLLSSFFTKGRTISALSIGVVVVMFVLQVIISMNDKLNFLKYICPFEWFKGSEINLTQELSITYILIAVVASILCFYFGIRRFKKMDVLI